MSLIGSKESETNGNSISEWMDGRHERLEDFVNRYRQCLAKNEVGLKFLYDVIAENHERARIGQRNIIVLGNLASYAIPVEELLERISNPFSVAAVGMPMVEVHTKGVWNSNHQSACIQSLAPTDVPASDVVASLILGLLSDEQLFSDLTQSSFRDSLYRIYGFSESPISGAVASMVRESGGELDLINSEITVKGTHGFTWHLGFSDPEVSSFSVSSSIRGGPKRMHMEDTFRWISNCKDVPRLIAELSLYPRGLLSEHQQETIETLAHADTSDGAFLFYSTEFLEVKPFMWSVARYFSPLVPTLLEDE